MRVKFIFKHKLKYWSKDQYRKKYMNVTYWHMQMHQENIGLSTKEEYVCRVLEQRKLIGLNAEPDFTAFREKMQVNDVVAIKHGGRLIALVQVIGGAYEGDVSDEVIGWMKYRRPIRVLAWELEGRKLPQPRGTLNECSDEDAPTTEAIKKWHEQVLESFRKRDIPPTV